MENEELNYILGISKNQAQDNLALDMVIRKGFSSSVISRMKKRFTITDAEIAKMAGMSARTLRHNLASGKRLSLVASDRIFRLISILDYATQVLENRGSVIAWMRHPLIGLGGKRAINCIETEIGANLVRDILGRIEWGVPS
ncbi:MAG: DUF2384 domain-containing protein [Patescibacteria group bacterium]|nr:DUF2384 domain-containing protein [Patescibacteria group bacterium]